MKKNNKKGFTLIEIIITLGLILLITGVAIGSFVGISKQKKKEEWALVKGQIETAAEQYFSSNKYLFEDIKENSTAYITVGELVEKSYLNNVSNPETGEKLSYCNQVQVTYEAGKYTGKYEDTSATNTNKEECNYTSGSIVIKEPGAAEGSISLEKVGNDPGPLNNYYKDRVKFVLNITKHKNSVSKVTGCVSNSANCSPEEKLTYNNSNGKAETIYNKDGEVLGYNTTAQSCFKVINNTSSGEKTLKICGTANIDSKNPTCTAESVTTWTNLASQNVTATCNDDGVGCEHETYTNTVTEESPSVIGTKTTFTVSDKLGHMNTCDGYAKIDRTAPGGSISINSTASTHNSNYATISVNAWDDKSGVYKYSSNFIGELTSPSLYFSNNYKVANEYDGEIISDSLIITDNAGNEAIVDSNDYQLYAACSNARGEYHYLSDSFSACSKACNGTQTRRKTFHIIDNITGQICEEEEAEPDVQSCNGTCSTNDPEITVKVYKRTSSGGKTGSAIASGTYQDTGNTLRINGWLNKENYPYGIYIKYSINRNKAEINSMKWHWNKSGLTTSQASSGTYSYSDGAYPSGGNNAITEPSGSMSLSADGARKGKIVIKDTGGNVSAVTIIANMDKVAPAVEFNQYPTRENCNSKKSIRTKYTVTDAISGLKTVKDYYGNDANSGNASSSYWRNRSVTSGSYSYFKDHNWGPTCYSKGTPSSGTCYYLKYYFTDVAGNVNHSYTSGHCATY